MKVLFICPKFFGYEIEIKRLLKSEMRYDEVIYLDLNDFKYEYKNKLEKLYSNLIYKFFFKETFKDKKWNENIIKEIEKYKNKIDIILYIRPDGVHKKLIKYLKNLNKILIGHQWDSMNSLHGIEKCIKYFDKFSTFDLEEAQKYKIDFIPNFYLESKQNIIEQNEQIEIFTVMSYDYRFEILEKIAKDLKERKVNYLFLIYTKNKKIKSDYIKIINEPISLNEVYSLMEKSKNILEIGHKRQGGLSFRAIDCLGKKKKLITNYVFIKEYDFYNENNIYILKENEFIIPEKFLEKKYIEIEKKIYENYSSEIWIKKLCLNKY
ncbi:MAG: hypothetical protein ACK5NU_06880 [Fusobacterium ulcerans]|uniref:hypothetical protein n=1 Tax=Fusobacterium ulcerans TaxID=861 RepID=UPI003A866054